MKKEQYVIRWQQIIDEQASSGMTISGWCKANHIYASYFYKCRSRLRERQLSRSGFIEIKPCNSEITGTGIRIVIDHGTYRKIEVEKGFDRGVLLSVVGILSVRLRKSC